MKSITRKEFLHTMHSHWADRLGNVSSVALEKTWEQIRETIFTEPKDGLWPVVQAPTGSGKTETVKVICSMMADVAPEDHQGFLIVTRRKAEADKIADDIKDYGKAPDSYAMSYHSGKKKELDLECLREFPVLVITHEAFTRALDPVGKTKVKWEFLHAFRDRTRKHIIVDEALDIVESAQVDQNSLHKLLGIIPQRVKARFQYEVGTIEDILNIFKDSLRTCSEKSKRGEVLLSNVSLAEKLREDDPNCLLPDYSALVEAMRMEKLDRVFLRRNDSTGRDGHTFADGMLSAMHTIIYGFRWYKKIMGVDTINSARCLIPSGTPGVVVMDATASSNVVYDILGIFKRVPVVEGAREYSNVTLNVSWNHRVGKSYMTTGREADPGELCAQLISNLKKVGGSGKETLIVAHKDMESYLDGARDGSFPYSIAHWGMIDGSNDFRKAEVVVIFGLHYRREEWAPNVFMACQGPPEPEWFEEGADRSFGAYTDIRESIISGQLVSDVIQATNRGRCRCVVNDAGGCEPMDLFILLPSNRLGYAIRDGLVKAMPGITEATWKYDGQKVAPKSDHEALLISFLRNTSASKLKVSRVRDELKIPPSSFDRLRRPLQDSTSNIGAELSEIGWKYILERQGKRQVAYFAH